MSDLQLKTELVQWCDEAEALLKQAAHNCSVLDLKMQYDYGAQLFKLSANGELVGYYLLRIDHLSEWSEAVFVAGAGNHPTLDVTTAAVLVVEKQIHGCRFLRIHTARAGLAKKIAKVGYKPLEMVLMKELI